MSEKPPKGGWLGPPGNTKGLDPTEVAVGATGKGWKWQKQKLSEKQQKKHRKFNKAMKKADSKGDWSFTWK